MIMALKKQDVKTDSVMNFSEHRGLDGLFNVSKKSKRIQVELSDELHTNFKIACTKQDVKMSAVIIQLMEQWLSKNA